MTTKRADLLPLLSSIPLHTNSGHRSYVINKFTCRQEFRSDATKNPFSHDQVCLFYHFLSEIKQHTTGAEFQELTSRFLHGYINKDLNAQAMAMDESLKTEDFNFMARLQKVDEASLAQKEVQSEEKELSLAIAHMAQDREAVKLHWAALKKHRNKSRSDTYEASHDADAIITKHAEAHTALHIPVNIVRPDALAAHVSDHVSTWAGKMEIPVSQVLQMYVAPWTSLGCTGTQIGTSFPLTSPASSQPTQSTRRRSSPHLWSARSPISTVTIRSGRLSVRSKRGSTR